MSKPAANRVEREKRLDLFEDMVFQANWARAGERRFTPAFWRALCPALTITEQPFAAARHPRAVPGGTGDVCREMLLEEGYFTSPPIIGAAECAALVDGAARIADAGFPTGFAALYDEFWQLFHGLELLLTPILAAPYRFVPEGLWLWRVPLDHPGGRYFAGAPHRDSLGPDPLLIENGQPGVVNVWIPLTDATPLNSCIYVLPADTDVGYAAGTDEVPANMRLQDVRAVPAAAGTVLGWTTHLLHWGGASSSRGKEPRVSAALYVERCDVPSHWSDSIDIGAPIPFEKRLQWILHSLRWPPGEQDAPPT